MKDDKIVGGILEICSNILFSSEDDVSIIENADFIDDLGMDSMTFITLVVEIEDAFGIIIPDEYMSMNIMKNLDSIVRIVTSEIVDKSAGMEN